MTPDLQLTAFLRDYPRFSPNGGVHPIDWQRAAGAASLMRKLGISGLRELTLLLEREETQLGFRHGAPNTPTGVAQKLASAKVCSELAKRELEAETPELNAMTLVAMVSAVDALVEYMVPAHRDMRIAELIREAEAQLVRQQPPVAPQLRRPRDELVEEIADALKHSPKDEIANRLNAQLPKIGRVRDVGIIRWERLLEAIGLGGGSFRLPDDLQEALTEIVAIRHILVHRAGRIDQRTLDTVPSLRQKDSDHVRVGELIRLTNADYLRYSAALWTYAEDIECRFYCLFDDWVNLAGWRQNHPIPS